jgi:hypothetical protein
LKIISTSFVWRRTAKSKHATLKSTHHKRKLGWSEIWQIPS